MNTFIGVGRENLRKLLDARFIFSHVLLPIAVLILYCGSYAYLTRSILQLPQSVNPSFASRSFRYLSIVLVAISIANLLIYIFIKPAKTVSALKFSITRLALAELPLLLLPMTPVVQYVINNHDNLPVMASYHAVGVLLVLSCLYIFVLPMVLGFLGSYRILLLAGLAFTYTIASMATLSKAFQWYRGGSILIEWFFLSGIFTISWVLNKLGRKWLILAVLVIFVANSSMAMLTKKSSQVATSSFLGDDSEIRTRLGGKSPKLKPDIYLLIYDSYAPAETMAGYGIDNAAQEQRLRESGFVLYQGVYSVGNTTMVSMGKVFNAPYEVYNDVRVAISGDGVVQNLLKREGYQTYGIFRSDYYFRTHGSSYNFSVPGRILSISMLTKAILMGEFRFDMSSNLVTREEFTRAKQEIFTSKTSAPRLVYVHNVLPGHSQNSGACLPDETQQYAGRILQANDEMNQDLEAIIQKDPAAIIIVAGDHGPYLTKNCTLTEGFYDESEITRLDIQDRYGVFLAIRWPSGETMGYDQIDVLQDVFPAVLAYMYGDAGILEAKVTPVTLESAAVSGASVVDNVIIGGVNDGEPLFLTTGK